MARIPRAKIDEVQAAADITEVAADYVGRLKKSGSRYLALCPFHDESSPSFSLSPEENLFYCFGCGKGGSIFTLVQEMEGVPFPEAVRLLADRFGVSMPEESPEAKKDSERRESVHYALRFAARFFYRQLTQEEAGQPALSYLRDERGLTPATIKRFGLGYAPDRWDGLLSAAKAEGLKPEVLEEAGLVIARKEADGYYDRYRGRVIFPIFSRVGRVLGFAGRILDPDEDPDYKQPKYINSPETSVYHKSRVLYGLHQAKGAIRREREVYLVEGYTDVIALHQAGIEHAVATCGTALTEEQVQLLSRYADRVVLLYDADEAGDRATARGMDAGLAGGLTPHAVTLPEGTDPDVFARERGPEALRGQLRKRQGVAAFKRARAERQGAFDTPEDKTAVMHAVVESLARIPDEIARENHLRSASETLGMYEDLLRSQLERVLSEEGRRSSVRAPRPTPPPQEEFGDAPYESEESAPREEEQVPATVLPQERNLLRLMLEQGRPMVEFILGHMGLHEFSEGPARQMAQHFLEMYEADAVAPRRFLEGEFGQTLQHLAASSMISADEPSENWAQRYGIAVPRLNADAREAAASSMTLLKLRRVDEAIAQARREPLSGEGDDAALRSHQQRLIQFQKLRKQIQARAFLDWDATE